MDSGNATFANRKRTRPVTPRQSAVPAPAVLRFDMKDSPAEQRDDQECLAKSDTVETVNATRPAHTRRDNVQADETSVGRAVCLDLPALPLMGQHAASPPMPASCCGRRMKPAPFSRSERLAPSECKNAAASRSSFSSPNPCSRM